MKGNLQQMNIGYKSLCDELDKYAKSIKLVPVESKISNRNKNEYKPKLNEDIKKIFFDTGGELLNKTDELHDLLYVENQQTIELEAALKTTVNNIVYLLGGRGSGKTTLLKHFLRKKGYLENKTKICLFWNLNDQLISNNQANVLNDIMLLLGRKIHSQFAVILSPKNSTNIPNTSFLNFFLVNQLLNIKNDPFSDFSKIYYYFVNNIHDPDNVLTKEDVIAIIELVCKEKCNPEENYPKITKMIQSTIDQLYYKDDYASILLEYAIFSANAITKNFLNGNNNNLIAIIDNLDAFPIKYQIEFIKLLESIRQKINFKIIAVFRRTSFYRILDENIGFSKPSSIELKDSNDIFKIILNRISNYEKIKKYIFNPDKNCSNDQYTSYENHLDINNKILNDYLNCPEDQVRRNIISSFLNEIAGTNVRKAMYLCYNWLEIDSKSKLNAKSPHYLNQWLISYPASYFSNRKYLNNLFDLCSNGNVCNLSQDFSYALVKLRIILYLVNKNKQNSINPNLSRSYHHTNTRVIDLIRVFEPLYNENVMYHAIKDLCDTTCAIQLIFTDGCNIVDKVTFDANFNNWLFLTSSALGYARIISCDLSFLLESMVDCKIPETSPNFSVSTFSDRFLMFYYFLKYLYHVEAFELLKFCNEPNQIIQYKDLFSDSSMQGSHSFFLELILNSSVQSIGNISKHFRKIELKEIADKLDHILKDCTDMPIRKKIHNFLSCNEFNFEETRYDLYIYLKDRVIFKE